MVRIRSGEEAGCDLGVAHVAPAEPPAVLGQLGSSGAVDGAIHAPATEQRRVGGVDDRIDVLQRDVAADQFHNDSVHGR